MSQPLDSYMFSCFTVTLPKYNPATPTATNPETPKASAVTTEPKTVTIVNAVSENGSFINACNLLVATAIANPTQHFQKIQKQNAPIH